LGAVLLLPLLLLPLLLPPLLLPPLLLPPPLLLLPLPGWEVPTCATAAPWEHQVAAVDYGLEEA
jgi:hypothetical protein